MSGQIGGHKRGEGGRGEGQRGDRETDRRTDGQTVGQADRQRAPHPISAHKMSRGVALLPCKRRQDHYRADISDCSSPTLVTARVRH